MIAFTSNDEPDAVDPWPAVAFREDRALWRDSLALLQSLEEKQAWPKTLDCLADLIGEGALSRSAACPLQLMGMSTHEASVLFWRHERLPLPLAYLEDTDLITALPEALGLSEHAGNALVHGKRILALLAHNRVGDHGIRNVDVVRKAIKEIVRKRGSKWPDTKNLADFLAPERPTGRAWRPLSQGCRSSCLRIRRSTMAT